MVEFGTLVITERVDELAPERRKMNFDPVPRVDGIDSSGDPLIELRSCTCGAGAVGERPLLESKVETSDIWTEAARDSSVELRPLLGRIALRIEPVRLCVTRRCPGASPARQRGMSMRLNKPHPPEPSDRSLWQS